MKKYVVFALFCVVCLLSESVLVCQDIQLQEIITKAKGQQIKIDQEIADATFDAKLIYREFGKKDKKKKEMIGFRRIYVRRDNKQHEEYLRLIINGEELTGEKFHKEVKDLKDKSRSDDTIMPLSPEGGGAYNFSLVGSEIINDIPVWVVEFKSKEKKDNYINDKGYISKDTYDIIRSEFEPSKKSRAVKNIELSMDYEPVQNYWMPAKFKMDLVIKVSFVFYLHIKIEDEYSNYRFNNGLDDSIFKDQKE